jgi:hypothetical protein
LNDVRQAVDRVGSDAEAVTEVSRERDGVFLADLFQEQERITGSSTVFASGSTADLADGHRIPDILLRGVGVEGHVRVVKDDQNSAFPGFETSQRRIEVVVNAVER